MQSPEDVNGLLARQDGNFGSTPEATDRDKHLSHLTVLPKVDHVSFTAPDSDHGLTPIAMDDDGPYQQTTMAGRPVLHKAAAPPAWGIYFQTDVAFANDLPASPSETLLATVTLLDRQVGTLGLQYDAHLGVNGANTTAAKRVSLAGSGEWIDVTFLLPRARFAKRQKGGADIRLHKPRSELIVHKVTLTRYDPAIHKLTPARRESLAKWYNDQASQLAMGPANTHDVRLAVDLAKKAVEFAQSNKYWNTLGAAHYRAGNWEDAIAAFEKSIELLPNGSYELLYLAMAHWQLGQIEEAHKRYGEAIEGLDPSNESLHLVRLHAKATALLEPSGVLNKHSWAVVSQPDGDRDKYRQAVRWAEEACWLVPQHGGYLNTLGVAHYRAGNLKDALRALETSLDLWGDGVFGVNRFFLAMAHWKLGHKDEARKWYDQAVEWMDSNKPNDAELLQFRAEAAALLGLPLEQPAQELNNNKN